jgi:anti-sigma regulatory factor (Ser/Thr protein kinase)
MNGDLIQQRHNAFVYEGNDQYAERSVGFLRDGLEAGEGVVVANLRGPLGIIREALGADAGRATFVDVGSLYTRPARTIAVYQQTLARLVKTHGSVRLIAQVQYGPTAREWDDWISYEALFTHATAGMPTWVVCSYDVRETPDPVLDGVWRTHPTVLTDDWNSSPTFEEPAQTVRRLMPEPQPLELRAIPPGPDLETLRERLAAELNAAQVPPSKVLDMLVAASEVAENARTHGGGIEELRVGEADGRFVCEIADGGEGFDHALAGYRAPSAGGDPAGLWIARQRTWQLEFLRSPGEFTTRLWL